MDILAEPMSFWSGIKCHREPSIKFFWLHKRMSAWCKQLFARFKKPRMQTAQSKIRAGLTIPINQELKLWGLGVGQFFPLTGALLMSTPSRARRLA